MYFSSEKGEFDRCFNRPVKESRPGRFPSLRRMTEELRGFGNTKKIVDDILIYSQNFDERVNYVTQFLNRCRNSSIRSRIDKFNFAESALNFAGVRLSQSDYKMQDKIFTVIRDFKTQQCFSTPTLTRVTQKIE